MRQRAASSVGVVVVGLLPALVGGPAFAALMIALCLIGYREFSAIAAKIGPAPPAVGYPTVAAFGVLALASPTAEAALGAAAVAVGLPLIGAVFAREQTGAFVRWALGVAGTLYLGVPLFAAVALRGTAGTLDADWVADLAGRLSPGWDGAARGMAWTLFVILATWLNDTGAYLVGRSIGRTPLLPRVSPKKTVEGSLGGLVAAAAVGAAGVALFGLGVSPMAGAAIGLALGALGQVGDLAESLLKRQAGVKDSGALIPGHGGVLDRIDALLFALTGGWFLALLADRVAR